jgi:alpha-N-arabinofuranosidase
MSTKAVVVIDEKIGRINPNIFGHFAEHLGRCIYEGIYVGEESSIPNTRGLRNDVVEALRKINPPVLRWPGGCFADDYHWRDGIGPKGQRPKTVNIHWGGVVETNQFGTHEFIDFCRLIGAEPYICLNLGSGSPEEARNWAEYCNYNGTSSLAEERSRNGSRDPFNVKYWGVGNELWGCGGQLEPDAYAAEIKRYQTFLSTFAPFAIACGPRGNGTFELRRDWVLKFFREFEKKQHPSHRPVDGFALHFYTRGTEAGGDLDFSENQYYWTLRETAGMEERIRQVRAGMDAYDPERKVGLIVDEWGTWHPEAQNDSGLEQQNTVRDALVAALNLDIFVRLADRVIMGNIAQTINVLQALILTREDQMIKTPTYHVYDMYKHHQGAESLRLLIQCPDVGFDLNGESCSLPVVAGSASLKERSVFLSLTNIHVRDQVELDLSLLCSTGVKIRDVSAWELKGLDIHDHNTFEEPDLLTPEPAKIGLEDIERGRINLSAHSVTTVKIDLG